MHPQTTLFALTLAAFFAPTAAAQPFDEQRLDRLLKAAIQQWQAPGLAAVIVHEDRVVYLKGHGVRELGRDAPVGPDTIFPLASCTKPFTTLALAMLADEGKLDWDDPVRKHLPSFQLADPVANAGCSLRDLVTHRTGVAGHDLLWYHSPWSLEERLRKIGRVESARPFRGAFQYQTILFGAAGMAAGRAADCSWDGLVAQRVLGPLGMKASCATFPANSANLDLASPHRKDEAGVVRRIARYPLERPDPAGSIHASARDLGQFLRFELGNGTWQGQRLVSERNLRETQTAQIVVRLDDDFIRVMNPETSFLTYGLGWIVQDYRGKRILMHGGAINGFRAHFTLVPQERLGIALLNNLNGCFLNLALSNQLLDLYFEQPGRDWSAYYLQIQEEDARFDRERARRLRAKKSGQPPAHALEAYAGTYRDPAYGPCEVYVRDGRLFWKWGTFDDALEHLEGDTFLLDRHPLHDGIFTFEAGSGGELTVLRALERTFRKSS